MEPGGAVGGRFNRIFAANGTRDARRSTDGKSIMGSSSPRLSSSWKETAPIELTNKLSIYTSNLPDFPTFRSDEMFLSFELSMLPSEPSSFSESLAPGLKRDTNVTISEPLAIDLDLGWTTSFGGFDTFNARLLNALAATACAMLRSSYIFAAFGFTCWWAIFETNGSISSGTIFFRRMRFLWVFWKGMSAAPSSFSCVSDRVFRRIGADNARTSRGRDSLSDALFWRNWILRVSADSLFAVGLTSPCSAALFCFEQKTKKDVVLKSLAMNYTNLFPYTVGRWDSFLRKTFFAHWMLYNVQSFSKFYNISTAHRCVSVRVLPIFRSFAFRCIRSHCLNLDRVHCDPEKYWYWFSPRSFCVTCWMRSHFPNFFVHRFDFEMRKTQM